MPRRKPPAGTELNSSHPLSVLLSGAYLLNDGNAGVFKDRGNGRAQSPAGGGNTDLVSGAAGFTGGRPCELGPGVRLDGTGYLAAGNPSQAYTASTGGTPGFSIAVKVRFASIPAGGVGVLSLGNTATESNPCYLLGTTGSNTIRVLLGDRAYQTLTAAAVAGVWYTVVSTFDKLLTAGDVVGTESHYLRAGGGAARIYQGSLTTETDPTGCHGTSLYLGSGFSGATAGDYEFLYVWDRCLTYSEALSVILDPFQMWAGGLPVAVKKAAAAAAVASGWDAIYPPAPSAGNTLVAY